MSPRYGTRVDASSMRCPRCLELWDPDYVDLDAEHAECRPCALVVALLGLVAPEWASEAVASRLDRVGAVPTLDEVIVSESNRPRAIEARGTGSFLRTAPRLTLGADGAREKRAFRKPNTMALGRIERVVPATDLSWERDTQGNKRLVATSLVCVVGPGGAEAGSPRLETGSWDAARYVAARFEVVRRALKDTGAYR